jgi:hypothetical protein
MSGDDHRDDDPPRPARPPVTADPDRAAILARRQRFIAIALTGLATAGCDKPAPKPEACLKVGVSEPKEPKATDDGKADDDDGARASGSSGGDAPGGTGGSSSGGEPPVAPTTSSPTPCLEVAPPMPCLSPPRPCLKVAPPKPCLDVAPPPKPKPKPPSPRPWARISS